MADIKNPKSYLDELVEYPAIANRLIGLDQRVVSLLTDNPTIDLESDEADEVFDKYLFSYGYVDSTTTEAKAYICSEAELYKSPTPTIQDLRVFVTILCHKKYMKIDPRKFSGMIGNRRDNLVRSVDRVLNKSNLFGIGLLTLETVKTVAAPVGFTARELTYRISDFNLGQSSIIDRDEQDDLFRRLLAKRWGEVPTI